MTKKITSINKLRLATGIQAILLDMAKAGKEAKYPCAEFERLICERHNVCKKQAEKVTEAVISTGILRWEIGANCFVL